MSLLKKTEIFKTHRIFIISMSLFIIFQLLIAFLYINPVDVKIHYYAAIDIKNGILLYKDIQAHVFPDGSKLPYPSYPPIYLGFLAFLFQLFGESFFILKLHLLIINCITAWLIYEIAKRVFSEESAIYGIDFSNIAMILFMANPITWSTVFAGFFDNFVIMLLLCSVLAFIEHYFALSGFMLALSCFSKQFPAIIIPVFLAILFSRENIRAIQALVFTFILTAIIISLPFFVRCPDRYFYEVFQFHLFDKRPSMSLFFYFFDELEFLAFYLQIMIIGLILFLVVFYQCNENQLKLHNEKLVLGIHLVFLAFISFNRIVYPHYLPYITFFFSITVLSILQSNISRKKAILQFYSISYILGALAALGYSVTWMFDITPNTFKDTLLYWFFAFIYNLTNILGLFSIIFYFILFLLENKGLSGKKVQAKPSLK